MQSIENYRTYYNIELFKQEIIMCLKKAVDQVKQKMEFQVKQKLRKKDTTREVGIGHITQMEIFYMYKKQI
jgi:hypothetical protein